MSLSKKLSQQIEDLFEEKILSVNAIGGGCIARAYRVDLQSKRSLFVKTGTSPDLYFAEAAGLEALENTKTIHCPRVLHKSSAGLVMTWIESESEPDDFWKDFGRDFARLHQVKQSTFGFEKDNFIGHTPQPNPVIESTTGREWLDFYWTHRLEHQVALAKDYQSEILPLFRKLEPKMERLLEGSFETPSLLHGDLWSGNYLCGKNAQPTLIDPAAYRGHREADLAMTSLFGSFPADFYEAYQKTYPLKEGWQERQALYQLYHLLNHLNLFGSTYLNPTVAVLRRYT